MSSDPTKVETTPVPVPAPAPHESWLQTVSHSTADALSFVGGKIGGAFHAAGNLFAPLDEAAEAAIEREAPEIRAEIERAAAQAWKLAAAGLDAVIVRNESEWTQNVEKDIMTYLLSLPPGAAPVASVLASLAVNTTKDLLDFAKARLDAQAATPLIPIGPPLTPPMPTTGA